MVLLFISDSQEISFRIGDRPHPFQGGYSPSELLEYTQLFCQSQFKLIHKALFFI